MAQWRPLWEVRGPGRAALDRGREAIERGLALGTGSARERAFLAALVHFYTNADAVDHAERVRAYEQAMERLHAQYPGDTEPPSSICIALLSSGASHPPDKTYARQKKAGELLQPVFRAQSDHPGVAHHIIHASDYRALAPRRLEAARRYASLAPDSPHARAPCRRISSRASDSGTRSSPPIAASSRRARARDYRRSAPRQRLSGVRLPAARGT